MKNLLEAKPASKTVRITIATEQGDFYLNTESEKQSALLCFNRVDEDGDDGIGIIGGASTKAIRDMIFALIRTIADSKEVHPAQVLESLIQEMMIDAMLDTTMGAKAEA